MFKKVYRQLLRLFPAGFRQRYGEEALQLFADRLSHERGWLARLRLAIDLVVDLAQSLPRAHRANYVAGTPAPGQPGPPSFGMLEKQPLRSEAIAVAGFVSLAALLLFPYVLRFSANDPTRLQNHRPSVIESVIGRLNPSESAEAWKPLQQDAGRPLILPQPRPSAAQATPWAQPPAAPVAPPALQAMEAVARTAAAARAPLLPVPAATPGAVPVDQSRAAKQAGLAQSAMGTTQRPLLPGVAVRPVAVQTAAPQPDRALLTADILSDPQGVDLGPYLRQVLSRVKAGYRPMLSEPVGDARETVIRFSIRHSGAVGQMALVESSRQPAVDQAAWASIIGAGSFSPLPAAFPGESLTLDLHFTVKPQP